MQSNWGRVAKEGLIGGTLGFAIIVVALAVLSMMAGQSPFYMAALLGAVLLEGVEGDLGVVTARYVIAYTAVHLAVFLVFGLIAARLAALADRGWQLWFVSLFFFIFVGFHLFAAVQSFASPVQPVLPDAVVWGAGFAASLAMILYLLRAHPRMRVEQSW